MMRCLFVTLSVVCLFGEKSLFDPSIANKPEMQKAFAEVDARKGAIQKEWITLTEIPSPSKNEKLRIAYMKTAMARVGLTGIEEDAIGNVWGTYKGSGGGPVVAFAAHTDTVFVIDTPIKVREVNGRLHAPGIADDTASLAALLNAFEIMRHSGIKTKGDVIFVATVQEEIGLLGAKYWLEHREKKPDMFVAVDSRMGSVGYGALLIEQFKFIFEGPTLHTLASKGKANAARGAARAILAIGEMKMPEVAEGGSANLPVANVGTLGGGTVVNATPGKVFITVDIRSQDIRSEQKLVEDVKSIAQRAANQEKLQLVIEPLNVPHDYSRALPKEARMNSTLVQTALAVTDHLKLNGEHKAVAFDSGSDDHNIGVAMGIPSIGIGAILGSGAHSLEESADMASIIAGTKYMILMASTLAGVN